MYTLTNDQKAWLKMKTTDAKPSNTKIHIISYTIYGMAYLFLALFTYYGASFGGYANPVLMSNIFNFIQIAITTIQIPLTIVMVFIYFSLNFDEVRMKLMDDNEFANSWSRNPTTRSRIKWIGSYAFMFFAIGVMIYSGMIITAIMACISSIAGLLFMNQYIKMSVEKLNGIK